MNVLHVISSVNPETGGPIEVITSSASVLSEHGCHQEILSLDSPLDPWTKTAALPLHAMGIRDPRYLAWRTKIPWLRYGYTPHFVPWLKKNANRYDAVIVHGLWNYVALGSWRALRKGKTPYFVYAHGMLDPYFNKVQPLKGAAKQILWWFSEGRLIANARNVFSRPKKNAGLRAIPSGLFTAGNASSLSAPKMPPATPPRRLPRSTPCFRK
jgi:Glycosyl transferase 4-like domain